MMDHVPARHRIQRGCMKRLTRSQTEAGVVPGAVHSLAHHESLGERAAVVSTVSADREQLVAAAGEEDSFIANVALQHRAVGDLGELYPLGEIGTRWPGLLRTHDSPPPDCQLSLH